MLTLPIKKQWFDMIALGEKKEEYRNETPYYRTRFTNIGLLDERGITTNKPVDIALRNGYSSNDPTLYVQVEMKHGYGKPEWGGEPGVSYYSLEIKRIYRLEVNKEIVWQNSKYGKE